VVDTFKTIENRSEGYFKDKGSKFFAFAFPVKTEEETKEILNSIKKEHHSARHHCYAWRIGTEEITSRANDDGEPSSTAGKPILGQLQRYELTNIFLVVVRYFGGTLLGTSGLIHAYRTAADEAIKNAIVVTRVIKERYCLKFTCREMNEVMQTIKQENLDINESRFDLDCRLVFSVRKSEAGRIEVLFAQIHGVEVKKINPGERC
jgi:uncharacterized YigZ family protein